MLCSSLPPLFLPFLKKTPADDFVSPSTNCTPIVSRLFPLLLNTFLAEMPPSMPSLDPQAHLRLWQSVTTRKSKCSSVHSSGKTLVPITTSHNMARVQWFPPQDFRTILNVSGLFLLRPNTLLAETPLSTPSSDSQVRLHLRSRNRTSSHNR